LIYSIIYSVNWCLNFGDGTKVKSIQLSQKHIRQRSVVNTLLTKNKGNNIKQANIAIIYFV